MSNDPIHFIMDKLYDFKEDTQAVVSSALESISDSDALRTITENEKLRGLGSKIIRAVGGATGTLNKEAGDLFAQVSSKPTPSMWERLSDWASRNKLLLGVLAAGVTGSTAWYVYRVNTGETSGPRCLRIKKTRRARKAANGGRIEVVVIAGSPAEPLTRTIATDLAKRGYIIYWTTSSDEEEEMVLRERNEDIRPLKIRAHDVASVRTSIKALANVLNIPATAFPGAVPHMLTFAGLIVVPDLYYPTGPVESIPVNTWSDLLNSKLLGPIFLLSNGLLELVRTHQSRVLLVSPTIMGSLNPGYHAAEGLITSGLSALSLSIYRELQPQGIPFIHIKMGSFDLSHGAKQHAKAVQNAVRADILSWPEHLRALYSRQYQSTAELQTRARAMGSPLRALNYTVFDALTARSPSRVYYAGKGSYLYSMLPKFLPEGFVGWLLHPQAARMPVTLERGWEPME